MTHIKIIGTSHIAPESITKVEKTIKEQKPDIIAIELDRKRLHTLLTKPKTKLRISDIKRIGLKGWLFAMLGAWMEKKLGSKVGVAPGADMLIAVKAAQQTGAKIALIDQDIEITLKRFSKALTWKEKFTFIWEIIKAIIFRQGMKIDLAKVPSQKIIDKLILDVKKKYPNVYKVLIEERNEFMAKQLFNIAKQYPESNIIAVVGAGHEKEITKILKNYINRQEQS